VTVTNRRAFMFTVAIALFECVVWAAQTEERREFEELRGTWILDKAAGSGSVGLSLPVAQTIVIQTNRTGITVTRDSGLPEVYRFDGTESKPRDPRSGGQIERRYSFALVARAPVLTSKESRSQPDGRTFTQIVADVYRMKEPNVLSVERQLSALIEPPGELRDLGQRNTTEVLIYRRQ
jgi:hypothetical protein